MRFRSSGYFVCEMDMTPMIDMSFQLISFFMFVMNYSTELIREEVQLPVAQLAQPVTEAKRRPLVLNIDREGTVYLPGGPIDLRNPRGQQELQAYLLREKAVVRLAMDVAGLPPTTPLDATVIVRADRSVEYEIVRRVLQACRKAGFHQYSLRAEVHQPNP
jgi:biopolymer transport protein ExbD